MDSSSAIKKLESIGSRFSDEQLSILNTTGGVELLAVAGSGKTFTMTNLIAKRILTGEIQNQSKILCCTFSKVGAEEMECRLNAILLKLGIAHVSVKTMHSIFYNILTTFGLRFNKVLNEGERSKMIRDAAKKVNTSYGRLSNDDIAEIGNTISLQVNELMNDGELFMSSNYRINIPPFDYTAIRQAFNESKNAYGYVDFDDMQVYVYNWLCVYKYQNVLDWCRERWTHLFIDEFQDTNVIQLAIIQAILGEDRPSERLVVVGDDDQCVYEWRGTDPRILINICGYFDLKKKLLTTNYRCPSNIVDKAYKCVVNMAEREVKSMKAFREGGEIDIIDCSYVGEKDRLQYKIITEDSECNNAIASKKWRNPLNIASEIVAERIYSGLSGNFGVCEEREYCCLSRTNANLRILSNMLLNRGIVVSNQKSMKISSSREWITFKRILKIADKNSNIDNMVVSDMVWQLVPATNGKFGKLVSSVIAECSCSLDWAFEKILNLCEDEGVFFKGAGVIAGNKLTCGQNISARTSMAIIYDVGRLGLTRQSLVDIINALRVDEDESIMRLLGLCRKASSFMYTTYDSERLFDAMIEYFISIVKERGKSGTEHFINVVEQAENSSIANNKVEMRTIHGAKGGEWKNVYILMDDNTVFPNFDLMSIMSENGVKDEELLRYIDSERRLHYVAQTRASRKLYFVAEGDKLSAFILESYCKGGENIDILQRAKKSKYKNGIGIDEITSVSIEKHENIASANDLLGDDACTYSSNINDCTGNLDNGGVCGEGIGPV